VRALPGSGLTLARAPAGLRSAVRRTLRHVPAVAAGRAFQKATLTASDRAKNNFFGYSLAVSGSTAVVGAYGSKSNTGAAYVFTRSGAAWSQQAELTASDGARGDYFGWSVAITGSTVLVGAMGSNNYAGAVYVFASSGATWSQQAELTASDGAEADFFGWSVALSGSTVVVGAFGDSPGTGARRMCSRVRAPPGRSGPN
jgi:hypothetical protein